MKEYIVPIYDDSPDHDEIFVGYIRENATEIVRCKDCKYMDENHLTCSVWESGTYYDGYCSYGERRSDEID